MPGVAGGCPGWRCVGVCGDVFVHHFGSRPPAPITAEAAKVVTPESLAYFGRPPHNGLFLHAITI